MASDNAKPATLYQACMAAGLPVDNHESDLYVQSSAQARELVKDHGATATTFISQIDGKAWLEIFGAYDPFWERAAAKRGAL